MALPLPTSLSPSKVSAFKECALAFRFAAIDRLPEPATPATVKGTLVHRALELLFQLRPAERTLEAGVDRLDRAWAEVQAEDEEFVSLELPAEDAAVFRADAEVLLRNYFELEDPTTVEVLGTEILVEVEVGTLTLRGIIDRLELDADGQYVVTDYKTGKSPGERYELTRMGGVQFYAYLCERIFGSRPARIQLLHLREPVAISTVPSEQSIKGLERRTRAIWTAVERACERDDFRPRPSRLCDFCAFRAYCPAWGGNPEDARQLAVAV